MARKMTKKMRMHGVMMELADATYRTPEGNHNILFAGFCIAYNYDQTTLKTIMEMIEKLRADALRKK